MTVTGKENNKKFQFKDLGKKKESKTAKVWKRFWDDKNTTNFEKYQFLIHNSVGFWVTTIMAINGFFILVPQLDKAKYIFIYAIISTFGVYTVFVTILLVLSMMRKLTSMRIEANRDGVAIEGENEEGDNNEDGS